MRLVRCGRVVGGAFFYFYRMVSARTARFRPLHSRYAYGVSVHRGQSTLFKAILVYSACRATHLTETRPLLPRDASPTQRGRCEGSVRPRGFAEPARKDKGDAKGISTHAGQPAGRTRAQAARPFCSYLWAGWRADPQPSEGHWRADGWLQRGWGHCPGGGEAPWPVAVAGVAVWGCRWRGRPSSQPA